MVTEVPGSASSEDLTPLAAWIHAADEITDVLATSRALPEAASGILRSLGRWLDADSGTVWIPDAATGALRSLIVWRDSAEPVAPEERTASPKAAAAGVAARAWALRRPIAAEDVSAGSGKGVPHGACAFPILYGGAAYGVVELARREPMPLDEDQRLVASQLGKQIGHFVAREDAFRNLVRSRRELTDLFENAPVGLHLLDREGKIVKANRAELDMLGYARDEYVGKPWREFHVDPFVADDMLGWLAAGEPGDQVRNFDARLKAKDGSVRWVRINANVLWDEQEFVHARVFTRDVTAGKEAETALRASEERYRRLVEGARDYAIHALDVEGRVTGWNSAAERLFGWTSEEIVGKDMVASFPEPDRAEDGPVRMLRLAADEGEFRHEGWRLRKDGSRFWAEVVYTAMRDPAGNLEGISQLTRDNTERRWLEALRRKSADLESANRAVIEETARRADLLRSIAAAVEGPAGEIETAARRLRSATGSAPRAGDADALLAAVAGLKRALHRLDEVAVATPAGREGAPEPVDLLRAAHETRDILRDAAGERRVRVDVDVDPSLGPVVADPARLRQVLYNLLSNAIKFSRERGRVALRVMGEGDALFRIEVEDSGLGIAPDELPRVFQAKASEGGAKAGMGLPATKRVVEQQGGRVGVHSTLGRGSVFFAVLPRQPIVPAEPEAEAQGEAPEERAALVVSSDPAVRASLTWTLGREGFDVVSVGDAHEGIDTCRERAFDAVALDLLLDGTGAVDFVALLRAEGASREAACIVAALGTREAGAAGLPVADLLPLPAPADRLFAALERLGVPRGQRGSVLVVDGDLASMGATSRTVEMLGYGVRGEPDGHAALSSAAEEPPAAVLLSPFVLGMNPFEFLRHLRQSQALADVPVVLVVPRELEGDARDRLAEAAGIAAQEGTWPRTIPPRSRPEGAA